MYASASAATDNLHSSHLFLHVLHWSNDVICTSLCNIIQSESLACGNIHDIRLAYYLTLHVTEGERRARARTCSRNRFPDSIDGICNACLQSRVLSKETDTKSRYIREAGKGIPAELPGAEDPISTSTVLQSNDTYPNKMYALHLIPSDHQTASKELTKYNKN